MPRPKRTKVAPSAPAPRLKKVAKSPIRAVAEASKAPFDDLYDVSDREEEVVISARRVKNSKGKEKVAVESSKKAENRTAADDDVERDEEFQETGRDRALMEAEDTEPILDDIDLESSSPAGEVGRRESTLAGGESMLAIGNFRRRARQPSILGRGPGRARSSSVESNLAYDNGLTSVRRNNTSAVGNFKRRPRENSIMGRNAAPSSMGLEMDRGTTPNVGSALNIGNFKWREREPSVLGTAQKVRRQPLDYEDDDEDDFNPDDESTPLNRSKQRNATSSSAISSSNSRKRKLSAVQVPQSSPTLPPQAGVDINDSISATGPLSDEEKEEEQERDHERDLSEPVLPSIEARAGTPELLSETMAPPQSSSPTPSSPELPSRITRAPSRGRRALRGRTPPPRIQDSPFSSPPSLTHSPNRPAMVTTKHKAKRRPPPPSTLSTAELQALLPRRRRRPAADTFSIPSSEDEVDISGLAPDDDELSHLEVRARIRASSALPRQTPAARRKVTKSKTVAKSVPESAGKRTYGRGNQTSDKENEEVDPDDSLAPLPDDGKESPENSQELEKRVGKELKQAARKFAEVDKWELEFEDVTASSSSPRDAR